MSITEVDLEAEDCPRKTGPTNMTCGGCGKVVEKPIVARVSVSGQFKTYRACPHCMSRVEVANARKIEELKQTLVKASTEPADAGAKCEHEFGYLSKRSKGMPVPEQCMPCARMVECMCG